MLENQDTFLAQTEKCLADSKTTANNDISKEFDNSSHYNEISSHNVSVINMQGKDASFDFSGLKLNRIFPRINKWVRIRILTSY
jgi:hypothetical protein